MKNERLSCDNEVRLEQDSNHRHTDHQDTAVKEAKRRVQLLPATVCQLLKP